MVVPFSLALQEVHGKGKGKLSDEEIEQILDDTILMIQDEHPEAADDEEGEEDSQDEEIDASAILLSPELEAQLDAADKAFHAKLAKKGPVDRKGLAKIIAECYGATEVLTSDEVRQCVTFLLLFLCFFVCPPVAVCLHCPRLHPAPCSPPANVSSPPPPPYPTPCASPPPPADR